MGPPIFLDEDVDVERKQAQAIASLPDSITHYYAYSTEDFTVISLVHAPPKVQKIAVIFEIEGLLCDNYWPQSESFGRPRKCVWAEEAVSKNAKQWSIARFASNRRLLAVGKNVRIHPTHKQHTKLFAGCQKSTESKQSPTCEKKALLKLD